MPKNYYEILGVTRNASDEEIKKSYRKLAKKYHPDVCSDDDATAKFKEISEAYQVLGDPNRRRDYDMFGTVDMGGGFGGFGAFDDLFNMFFTDFSAGGRARTAAERGSDLGLEIEVDFKEAVFGAERNIDIQKMVRCTVCNGSGAKEGTSVSICPECGGSGQIQTSQKTFLGNFVRSYPCERCRGSGQIIASPCSECNGQGRKARKEGINITIPAGIVDGMRLRMDGHGQAGIKGGPPGDLYVTVHVKPHEFFIRDGDNIVCRIPLTFSQAAIGTTVEIPTLDGTEEIKIPAGTQPGAVFYLKGKGIPRLGRRGQGDMLVQVNVEIPTKLTRKEKELIKELAKERGEDLSSLSPGFLKKLKKMK